MVEFAQIWQNYSDFFDFLFLFDFQVSESKHFSPNLPQSPPFHQNLAISRRNYPKPTPNWCDLVISRHISPYLTHLWYELPPNHPKVAETRLCPGQVRGRDFILDRGEARGKPRPPGSHQRRRRRLLTWSKALGACAQYGEWRATLITVSFLTRCMSAVPGRLFSR